MNITLLTTRIIRILRNRRRNKKTNKSKKRTKTISLEDIINRIKHKTKTKTHNRGKKKKSQFITLLVLNSLICLNQNHIDLKILDLLNIKRKPNPLKKMNCGKLMIFCFLEENYLNLLKLVMFIRRIYLLMRCSLSLNTMMPIL